MVYYKVGILGKEGLSWEVVGTWEEALRICLGVEVEGWGWGRYVFHVIFKMNKVGLNLVTTF